MSEFKPRLPRFAEAVAKLTRRSMFLPSDGFPHGEERTYFHHGQTPFTAFGYTPPTDWLKAGALLRVPKTVWVTLNLGVVMPTIQVTVGVTWPSLYIPQVHTAEYHPDIFANGVFSGGRFGIIHTHAWHGPGYDDSYNILPPAQDPIPYSQTLVTSPFKALHADIRAKALAMLGRLAADGKTATLLADFTIVQKDDADTSPSGRTGFDGYEFVDGNGHRLVDLFDPDPPAGGGFALSELMAPVTASGGYFGVDFLHIHIGHPVGVSGTEIPDGAEPTTAGGRLDHNDFAGKAARFHRYKAIFFGTPPLRVPNVLKGTGVEPIAMTFGTVPDNEEPTHTDFRSETHGIDVDIYPQDWSDYTTYFGVQDSHDAYNLAYQSADEQYRGTTGPDAPDYFETLYTGENAVTAAVAAGANARLASEPGAEDRFAFTYAGTGEAVPFGSIEATAKLFLKGQ